MREPFMGRSVSLRWLLVACSVLGVLALAGQAQAVTYYVSTAGNDNNNGTSSGTAFRTIQKGIDTANAGDTIEVAAGTYREKPVFDSPDGGTPAAPLTLHGAAGAIIDASNAASDSLTWTLQSGYNGGLYTAPLGYNTNAVFVNDQAIHEVDWATASTFNTTFNIWYYTRLFTYGLKNVAGMPDYDFWSAIPVGWDGVRGMAMLRTDNNYLYLKCMPGGEGSTPLVIPSQTVRVSSFDANVILIDGANDVIVDGFRLKYGYDSIRVTGGAKGIEIKNCVIRPCFNGVWIDGDSSGVSVHNCEISTDRMEDKSTKNRADNVWHMNKSHLLSTGNQDKWGIFAKETDGSHHFYDNWIHDIGVGIGTGPNHVPPDSLGEDSNIEINHNLIQDTYQDGMGIGRDMSNMRVHHNVLDNVLQFGRLFDAHYGPAYIYNNIMISGPITQNGLVFYSDFDEAFAPDIYFYHNTLTLSPDVPPMTEPGCVVHNAFHMNNLEHGGYAQENNHIYNNFIVADRWLKTNVQFLPGSSTNTYLAEARWQGDYNVYASLTGVWLDNRYNPMVNGVSSSTTTPAGGQAYAQSRGIDLHSLWTLSSPGFTNFAAGNLSLSASSPARNRGTNLTTAFGFTPPGDLHSDAGAIAYGQPMLSVPGTSGGALSSPWITSVTPGTGASAGGGVITIMGSSLTGASVSFGGTAATGVAVSPNGHHLICTLPAHAVGAVNVTVTTGLGTSNAKTFTYTSGSSVTTLNPIADSLVASANATVNYGTNNNIQIQNNNNSIYLWGLLKFDLNSLGGSITNAKLRLYKNNATANHVESIFSTTDGWAESTVNWNNRPAKGTSQATLTVGAANAWYEWDITSYITAEFAGDKIASMYVTEENALNSWNQFRSREWASFLPQLVVTTGGGGGSAPTLSNVSPNTGTTAGGTSVTLTGTNFISGATVSFGGTAATSVVVVNSTTITCTSPAKSAGVASVTVTTSNGTSGGANYTYVAPAVPTLTSVSPNSGPTAGGTGVTLTGTNFISGATVSFSGTAATSVMVVNSTTITCTSQARSAGAANVSVTTSNGTSGTQTFTYVAAPTLTTVAPNTGTTAGGTAVTLTGTNFVSGATVSFGGTAATSVVVVSGTSITCVSPAKAAGTYSVTVTTTGGTSGGQNFTYTAGGGTTVTLAPTADSHVYAQNPTGNSGTADNVQVQANGPSWSLEGYFKFSLTGVSGTTVTSAKLRVYKMSGNIATHTISAYDVSNDTWTETGITWNNKPAKGTAQATTSITNTNGYYEWDITSYVNAQFAGDKTVSINLADPTALSNKWTKWYSKEWGTSTQRPQLVVITQ